MNRLYLRLFSIGATMLSLAACSQEDLYPSVESGNAVRIGSVSIGGEVETRVSENPDDGGKSSLWNFDGTEQIAVQVKDGVQGVYTLMTDKSVTADQPTYWTGSGTHTINAWYPVESGNIDLSNQTAGHLAYALFATATGTYPDAVALNFSHSLAKLRVRLKGDVDAIKKIEAKNFTSCSLNTTDGTVTGNDEGDITLTKANYGTETYWEANFAPGAVANDVLRFNDSFNAGIASVTQFEAGKIYTATYTVMASDIVTFEGCTIADWGKEQEISGTTDPASSDYFIDKDGSYYVYTEAGLMAWADHVNGGNYSTNLTLMNDIVMTMNADGLSNWTPIGKIDRSTDYYTYTGTIDGNGYTIFNMVVNNNPSDPEYRHCYYAAMVVSLRGTIQNLTIGSGSHFNARYQASSVTVDNNGGKVINCHSAATVEGKLESVDSRLDFSIGGIVSNNWYSNANGESYVVGCSFSGQVIADANNQNEAFFVGGVVGNSWTTGNGNQVHVVGCSNTGSVKLMNAGSTTESHVGGIVGSSYKNGSDLTNVTGCVMAGKIGFENVEKREAQYSAFDAGIGEIYNAATATHVYWTPGCIEDSWRNPYRPSGTYSTLQEVDGTTIDWETATSNVNTAIEEWNAANGNLCPNRFEQQNGKDQPPTLIKK